MLKQNKTNTGGNRIHLKIKQNLTIAGIIVVKYKCCNPKRSKNNIRNKTRKVGGLKEMCFIGNVFSLNDNGTDNFLHIFLLKLERFKKCNSETKNFIFSFNNVFLFLLKVKLNV